MYDNRAKLAAYLIVFLCFSWMCPAQANLFGDDQRVALASRDYPASAIGVVQQETNDDRLLESCTGSLVGPRLVLTAAHCVAMQGRALDPAVRTVFIPGLLGGHKPPGYKSTYAVEVWAGDWRTEADSRAGDWAILLLNEKPTSDVIKDFGYLEVSSDPPVIGEKLTTIGYSTDFLGGLSAGAHVNCETRAIFSDGVFHHDCDVYAGASGGPILANFGTTNLPELKIIGIHTAHKSLGTAGLWLHHYQKEFANLGTSAANFIDTLLKAKQKFAE